MTDARPAHSHIGASSYYRWKACPGSVRLSATVTPKASSVYAEEGTLAHEVAAVKLTTGTWLPNMDPEMIEAISVYTDAIERDRNEAVECLVEHRFDLGTVHPGLFGTADCVVFNRKEKLLQVWDLKYGQGLAVEVKDNVQLKYYGLGALLSTRFPADEVELIIAQPRCSHPDGPIRRHRIPAISLIDFAADLAEDAIKTEAKDAPLNPGEHCRFCPAAGVCPQIHTQALEIAKTEFSPAMSYDPVKLAAMLEWLPVMEAWIKNVRDFAYAEAGHGRPPPGWKLVAKRATRRWRNEEKDVVAALKHKFGFDLFDIYEQKLRSPAQIEKVLDKDQKKALMDFVVSESSGNTLAPDSDPRKAINTSAQADFLPIEIE